jgi:hypothetical protein
MRSLQQEPSQEALTIYHRKWRDKDVVREMSLPRNWNGMVIQTRKRPIHDSEQFSDLMSIDSHVAGRDTHECLH